MARRYSTWLEYLREGEQASSEDDLHVVRDTTHKFRRQEVRHQTCREVVAEFCIFLAESPHEQIGKDKFERMQDFSGRFGGRISSY